VYLTEIVSQWNGYDGKPYHYGFVDYVINEAVSLDTNGEKNFSNTQSVSDYDYENLMIMAVVFNSKSEDKYVYPNENEHSFDAYYADAVNATSVAEGGNLPPEVGISNPVKGSIHIFGIPLLKTILGNTWLIGGTNIVVNADDDSNVEKVEFYIDGELISTVQQAPYEYQLKRLGLLKSILFRKHTIKVIAYDDTGKNSSDEIEILVRL